MSFNSTILIVFSLICLTFGEKTVVEQAFEDNKLVPDVVSKAPKDLLTVTFDLETVYLGNELTPEQAGSPPKIKFNGSKGSLYTLIEVDPDAPNLPEHTNIRHWLITNIPGESSNTEQGELITEYASPQPPVGDGPHRYTLLIYKQLNNINVEVPESRFDFNLEEFVSNYTLEGPLFGNFFKAQNL